MSDAQLRTRQRAWESNPGDQEALAAYIAALRGAGDFVPLRLLSQRLFPARMLEVLDGWDVSVEVPAGSRLTKLRAGATSLLEVPEHRRLIVAIDSEEELQASWELLAAQGVSELALDCEGLTGPALCGTARLPDLEVLRLFNASQLRGEDWAFLNACSLHTLATDHLDVPSLECIPASLQSLELGAVDSATLARLARLAPRLGSLELSGEQLAETDFAQLRGFAQLSSLQIDQPLSFSLEALVGLASLDLEELRLGRGTELPEETLQHVADSFPRLQCLELAESFEDLGPLSTLSLERLRLVRFVDARQLIEDTLVLLPPTLRSLHLSASLGDASLRALADLSPQVRDLDLHLSSDVRGDGLSALAKLPRVRSLSLSVPGLEEEAFRALLEVESLTDLTLSDTTNEQVARLGCLSRLRSLFLWPRYDEILVPSALACLEGLPRLESLSLSRARIGGSLAPSHGFRHLEDLSILSCEVSREAIADIAKCRRLWLLYLTGCGPLEGVEALTELPELESMSLPADALSEATIAHLRANLPEDVLHLGT